MPILYYADSIFKRYKPTADQQPNTPITAVGKSALSTRFFTEVWRPTGAWNVNEVILLITGSGAGGNKDYSIGKLHGRGILTNWNDSLWITRSNTAYRIVIPQGFYDNLGVCAALKTALDTFPKFIAQGVTFAVVYDLATGLFTITPSSGTIGYFHDFVSGGHLRHSTAESVFGLMTDVTSESSSLTSNIAAPSIGTRFEIVGGIASAATKIALTEQLTMDIDTALYIEVSKLSNANLEWRVVHQEY